jgi:hypothetical protein
MGGKYPPLINSDHNTIAPFSTTQGIPSEVQEFTISGINIPENLLISFHNKFHFELKRKDDLSNNWVKSLTLITVDSILNSTTIQIRYNPTEPSYIDTHTDYLNFYVEDAVLIQGTVTGTSSRPVLVVPPVATDPTSVSLNGFTANWTDVYDATGYYLTVYNTSEGTSVLNEEFNNGLTPPIGWTINASSVFSQSNYAGTSVPSIQLSNTGDSIQTEVFDFPVTEFSFYVRSFGEISGKIRVEARNGAEWITLDDLNVIATLNTTKTYVLPAAGLYNQFRIVFKKGIASVAIDDVAVKFSQRVEFNAKNLWVTENSAPINFILPGRTYNYIVRASDKTYNQDTTIKFENITAPSNQISVVLTDENIIRYSGKVNQGVTIYKDLEGTVVLDKSNIETENAHIIYVYSSDGKLIRTIESDNNLISLSTLTKGRLYILKIGEIVIKFIL